MERNLERSRKAYNNSPYSLPDLRPEEMLEYAANVISTQYSESANPDLFRKLSVIRSPKVLEAIIAFFKIRALHGHKAHWIPKLDLQLTSQDRLELFDNLKGIQHPSDAHSLIESPLTRAITGESLRISKLLLSELLYSPFELLFDHNLRINIEPSKYGQSVYRTARSCKGLWYAVHNQHLYENIRLLEARHPEVFFLIRHKVFSEKNT